MFSLRFHSAWSAPQRVIRNKQGFDPAESLFTPRCRGHQPPPPHRRVRATGMTDPGQSTTTDDTAPVTE